MPCEICGAEGELVRAKIEGSVLRVCKNCAKFGEVIPETKVLGVPLMRGGGHKLRYGAKPIEGEFVLVSGYGSIVRKKREGMGLSQKDFAQRLNEKESIVRQIEHEHIKPDEKTTKKIEGISNQAEDASDTLSLLKIMNVA